MGKSSNWIEREREWATKSRAKSNVSCNNSAYKHEAMHLKTSAQQKKEWAKNRREVKKNAHYQ